MTNATIFISYSHKDESLKDKLVTHLGVLQQEGLLDIWEDRRIEAGEDWYKKIEEAIQAARVAILLVSADFLTSKFILGEEVPRLLKKSKEEGLVIFPVIIKPCSWKQVGWLAQMNLRPKDGRPISGGNDYQIDTDMVSIAEEIAAMIQKRQTLITAKPEKSGEDEVEQELIKLIFEHGNAATKREILNIGETWNIGGGWELTAQSLDVRASPRQAWLRLSKDGIVKEDKIVAEGKIYSYVDVGETGIFLLATYVDTLFAGATCDLVVLISAEPKTIKDKIDKKLMRLILDHGTTARPENLGENEIEKELIKLIFEETDATEKKILGVGSLFYWDEIQENFGKTLIEFLKWRFGVNWIERAKIDYVDDGRTIKISSENNIISFRLNNEKTKAILTLDDGKIYEFSVIIENGKLKIYDDVWNIGDGWVLTAQSVDAKVSPRQAWLRLSKDGIVKEDMIVVEDKIYSYVDKTIANKPGDPLFAVYIDAVFSSTVTDLVVLISSEPKKLKDEIVKKELNRLILEHENADSEKKILEVGNTWDLGGGWALTAMSIDAKIPPRKAWLTLSKDSIKKEDIYVVAGKMYKYVESIAGGTDVPLFETFVDAVFAGATTDLVQFSIRKKKS